MTEGSLTATKSQPSNGQNRASSGSAVPHEGQTAPSSIPRSTLMGPLAEVPFDFGMESFTRTAAGQASSTCSVVHREICFSQAASRNWNRSDQHRGYRICHKRYSGFVRPQPARRREVLEHSPLPDAEVWDHPRLMVLDKRAASCSVPDRAAGTPPSGPPRSGGVKEGLVAWR